MTEGHPEQVEQAQAPRPAGHPDPLSVGDAVVLVERKGRRHLLDLEPGRTYHFHGGAVPHDDLLGRPEGSHVTSSKGTRLLALRPTGEDWTEKAPRGAQVVYTKDQAMIVALGDIAPGARVVEAGAGSGALTCALLRAVGSEGCVISFELRPDHAKVAERTVGRRFGGWPSNWRLEVGDVNQGLPELACDRVVLDVLEPWTAVPAASQALHPGGLLVVYTPTVPQVMRVREALAGGPWALARTLETLQRSWHVDGLAVRPDHRMVAHTAFLTTARRRMSG